MKTIELIANVDEQHQLSVEVPADVKPGAVRIVLALPTDEEVEEEGWWQEAVSEIWAAHWSDPREDIYTLEDGKPEDEPR
jgi:hypothetical protein